MKHCCYRLFCLLLCAVLILGTVPGAAFAAESSDLIASGTCLDNLTWKLDKEGTLTISGQGAMNTTASVPWAEYCSKIKSVVIQNGVTSIGDKAFFSSPLSSVTIPQSVTAIGDYAFYFCTNLTSVDFPDNLQTLGIGSFSHCHSLTSLQIPQSVESIGRRAFENCAALTDVTFSGGLKEISDGVFSGCKALKNIIFSEGLEKICDDAFYHCTSLTEITFPGSISYLDANAFNGCSRLSTVRFQGDAPIFYFEVFSGVTATIHYPANGKNWSKHIGQNYGGTLTWEPYGAPESIDAPKISADTLSSGVTQLSWKGVTGGHGYRVYRSPSKSGSYTHLGTVTKQGNDGRYSFTDDTAEIGTKYYYKVKAMCNGVYSDSSNIVTGMRTLAQPEVSMSVNYTTGKPVVKWETVEGAEKYFIYRATSKSGKYTRVKTAIAARSYEDTKAKAGTNYYYKIKAIHEDSDANSVSSEVVNRVCDLKRPSVTISLTTSSRKPYLKWKEISGAKKYYVYRATSEDGQYDFLGSTTSEKYIDKKAAKGKTYYYRVKAVHSKTSANSAYSPVKSIKAK